MKAIRVSEYGGPSVLKLEEIPSPQPGPGQVLVRHHAVGINPVDTYLRSNTDNRGPKLPYTPGGDSAGPFSIRHPASNSPAKSQVCSPVRVIVMRSQPSLRRTCRTASGCREFSMTLKAA